MTMDCDYDSSNRCTSDAITGNDEKELETGFLFLEECEISVLVPPSADSSIEDRWLSLKYFQNKDNSKGASSDDSGSGSTSKGCSHCMLNLLCEAAETSDGLYVALKGTEPRCDGTLEDSRPDPERCTCQTRRKQRSDASLILGLALSCQEMGHIRIQKSSVALHQRVGTEDCASSTHTSSMETASAWRAAIFITFSVPEMTTSRHARRSPDKIRDSTRSFISNSAKPLPPATQLLLSLMRSDWDNIEAILQHPKQIWDTRSTRRVRRQRLSLFPPTISLDEVYKRIGGAASTIDHLPSPNAANDISQFPLESLPNDILMDHIATWLRAGSLDALRRTCKSLHFRLRSAVPGLRLRLYAHQIKSLSWMRLREARPLVESDIATVAGMAALGMDDVHRAASGGASVILRSRSGSANGGNQTVRISQYTGDEITIRAEDPLARRVARGGMLCDDPGLGKTITVISLILQTLGTSTVLSEQTPEIGGVATEEIMSAEQRIFVEYWRESVVSELRKKALIKLVNSFLRSNRDTDYFVRPVDPMIHGCPDYFDIIKDPICFNDINRKIENGEYGDCFQAFEKDAELCFSNAMEYNPAGSVVYDAAKRMMDEFSKVVDTFKAEQVLVAKNSFRRASTKPNSAVAALVEQNRISKLKSCLIPSSATLLVVPSVLLEHWEAQLRLHVDLAYCTKLTPIVFEYSGKAESGLRMEEILVQCRVRKTHFPFIFIDKSSTKKLPSPDFLAMFSIVITTNQRFTNEWKNGSFEEQLKTKTKTYVYDFYAGTGDSEEASNLLKVNWLRMIVDEGHSMGRGRDTSSIAFASWVVAERRWCMTGTPTRQTNLQSGLSNLVNLMQYLQHDFFSRRYDGAMVWQNLIARGWNRGLLSSFYRLRSLLELLMVRHTKLDIEELQPPRYETTTLQMSPEEVKTYNTLVCAVQSNLIITSMKGKTSGLQDSLLHRSQAKHARDAMRNVRLVCSGGTQVVPTLTQKFWEEFIRDLNLCNPEPSKMEEVKRYLSRAVTEQLSPCGCCGIMLTTLLVFPCGDLVCTECVNSQSNVCVVCEKEYDVDVFQKLQPGMDYQWLHNIEEEAKKKKAKIMQPQQEEADEDRVELREAGAGMLAPADTLRRRRRSRKPGDGHKCVYCPKRVDGTCELCWKQHDSCNLIAKGGKCEVCHSKAEPCPSSETKPSYVINKLLQLIELDQRLKEGRQPVVEAPIGKNTRKEGHYLNGRRPLKVIVFSQFRKVLNTIGDRLLRRFGTACVAEYWGKFRKQELHKFVYEEDCFCMLLGRDGSEGLDLSFVTHIFFVEQVWDKSLQQQAVSRAYRMGAKGSVSVETLIAKESVEETMFRLEKMVEDEHQVDAAQSTHYIQTTPLTTLSTKETDYQRAKLQILLKSLKLISNSSTSSFGAVKRTLMIASKLGPSQEPRAKKPKMGRLHVRFDEGSFI